MTTPRWTALALAGALAVAVTATARAQKVDIKPTAKVKDDKYVITAEEIAEHAEVKDGYDIVRLLRNQWLRPTRTSGNSIGSMSAPATSRPGPAGCGRNSTDPACATPGPPSPTESGSAYADAD